MPDELRRRYLEGAPESVLLRTADGDEDEFNLWGPSTTDTDTKGREYPTGGMTKETQEVADTMEEFWPEEILVAWGDAANGDLAVVLKDGSLGWWFHEADSDEAQVVPVEVIWEP